MRFYQLQCLGRIGKLLVASLLSVLVLRAWSCYNDKVILEVTLGHITNRI